MTRDYSEYQKKVIRRFYDNRDGNDRQRLAEIVSNLYLSSPGKRQQNLWKSAEEIMQRLNVPASRIAHVIGGQDPATLAEVVKDVERGVFPPPAPKSPPGSTPQSPGT